MKRRPGSVFEVVCAFLTLSCCFGFYLPGLAPVSFCKEESDDCKVKHLTSLAIHLNASLLAVDLDAYNPLCCALFPNDSKHCINKPPCFLTAVIQPKFHFLSFWQFSNCLFKVNVKFSGFSMFLKRIIC